MKHSNRINLIVVLGLLLTSSAALLPGQPVLYAAPAAQSALLPAEPVVELQSHPDNSPTPDSPPVPGAALGVLYPEALDPPGSCGVPTRGPFGQDVEILVGPWGNTRPAYALHVNAAWEEQTLLPGSYPTSNMVAVARGIDHIVAAWVPSDGTLRTNTWTAGSGWSAGSQSLGMTVDGNPALVSRHAYNWAVFARNGAGIQVRQWNDGELGAVTPLPGVTGVASDPVAVSTGAHHMAVFYRDSAGAVWFTETAGGPGTANSFAAAPLAGAGAPATLWRPEPVFLSGPNPVVEEHYRIYLPLVVRNYSRTAATAFPQTPRTGLTERFLFVSELNAISRNENHMAVLGVDADNQLWIKEWTFRQATDWRDTAWVKLMDNVAIERPAVASRHINHLAVAVRDTAGRPWIIEWTHAGGWRSPLALGGTRSEPLTLAAPRIDALAVFSVQGGKIVHKQWTEAAGWGSWQTFDDTAVRGGHILAAVTRQMDDLMLLGNETYQRGAYKHFTALGQPLVESLLASGTTVTGHRGGQTLAWVDGKTLWAGAVQAGNSWRIEVLDIATGAKAGLTLPGHPWAGTAQGRVALAAGDLSFNGDDQIVIATTTGGTPTVSISVIDITVSPALALVATPTLTRQHHTPYGADDALQVGVAIGDLDGDGRRDDVAVTYLLDGGHQSYLLLYTYAAATQPLQLRAATPFPYTDVEWTPTAAMSSARYGHVAAALPDNRVLVAGGWDPYSTNTAAIFNAATDTWSAAPNMNTYRVGHTATPLPDGRVLVAGGGAGANLGTAQLYRPATNDWLPTPAMTTARSNHTATLLDNGQVLVVGGMNSSNDASLHSAELYNPATGSAGAWTATGSSTWRRVDHTATLLPDGQVLVAGGYSGPGWPWPSNELYDPATGTWSSITGRLDELRRGHTATLLPDGRVLVAGGTSYYGTPLTSAEIYNPVPRSWSSAGDMTSPRRGHTATLLPDGRVLVAGGANGHTQLASAEVYDPAIGTWTTVTPMGAPRTEHTATLLPDGAVLAAGGHDGLSQPLAGAEIYDPGIARDLKVTIGRVIDRDAIHGQQARDQLIFASSYELAFPAWARHVRIQTYAVVPASPEAWTLLRLNAVDGPTFDIADPPWIGLATGDMDAGGLERIATTSPGAVHVVGFDRQLGTPQETAYTPDTVDRVHPGRTVVAMGDLILNGRAEIAYWTADNRVAVLALAGGTQLYQVGSIAPSVSDGELLIGDLDDNSFHSELAGCASFSEISVIAVLNGAPRCYAGGLPAHDSAMRYARTVAGGSSSAWGTTTSVGASLTLGYTLEFVAPFFGTSLGEVRSSVTRSYMLAMGQTHAIETSVTRSSGYNNAGATLGIVVYNAVDYRCFYYDIYGPAAPTDMARAMICRPLGNAYESFASLEQWHASSFRQQAGGSWIDVGRRSTTGVRTNDVTTYASGLPIDRYQLKHIWPTTTPLRVNYDVSGGVHDWSVSQLAGGSQEESRGFETQTTISGGATITGISLDTSVTLGHGGHATRSVSWSNALEMGGAVHFISNPAFQNCVYTLIPYIHHAKGTTLAGVTYPYLEVDYYVPSLTGNCSAIAAQHINAAHHTVPNPLAPEAAAR